MNKLIVKAVTQNMRIAFPQLFVPKSFNPKQDPKFSLVGLAPKTNSEGKSIKTMCSTIPTPEIASVPISLSTILRNAKFNKFGAEENWPDDLQMPIKDGDDKKVHTSKKGEIIQGYKGHWAIHMSASQNQRPAIVDKNMVAITEPSQVYPGCWCRISVYASYWNHPQGGHGIAIYLNHIQKVKDGTAFGGRAPVEQVFTPINDDDDAEEFDFA